MSKIRIYDLAKELKLDSKKVMDEVRRFGYDVRVASNSVPDDIAEKVRNLYFPKRTPPVAPVKLVKTGHGSHEPPVVVKGSPVPVERQSPTLQGPKLIKAAKKPETPVTTPVSVEKSEPPQPFQLPQPVIPSTPVTTVSILIPTPVVAAPIPTSVVSAPIVPPSIPTPAAQVSAPVTVSVPEPVMEPKGVTPISGSIAPQPVVTEAPPQPVEISASPAPEAEVLQRVFRIEPPPPVPAPPKAPTPPPAAQLAPGRTISVPTIREITIPKPPPPVVPPVPKLTPPQAASASSGVKVRPLTPPPQPPAPRESVPTQRPYESRDAAKRVGIKTGPIPAGKHQPEERPAQVKETPKEFSREGGGRNLQPSPGGETPAVPQRTTYIPPKDQKRKGRRSPVRGAATGFAPGKREQHERDLNLKPIKPIPVSPRPVFTELKPIRVPEGTTVKELAEKLDVKPKDVVALLFSKGLLVTINQSISEEMMREVGREFGFEVTIAGFEEMVAEQEFIEDTASTDDDEPRAPVIAVMGHVDHGKTSLLDAIRNTQVAAGEAGGITQHIGAYSVMVSDPDNREVKRRIVFLDTPGHEAFTLMRARGAKGADVAIIVVAADDGVMPQTLEAIDHARAAGVPIVVAINKIDKPEINIDRVKKGLADYGLVWDGWGGETVMVEISAKKRINLDLLLEMTLLTSDILDLKANPKRLASGVVLEARLDRGRGPVACVLVQQGTLRVGDPIIAGLNFGRVRALLDDHGRIVQDAGPAIPVEILGLQGVPKAGDLFQVVTDPAKAQEIAVWRQSKHRMAQLSSSAARGLEDVFEQMKAGKLKELLVILKADVQGSVEVLRDTLEKLSTEKVKVRVIRADVGAITESDVLLASASNDMAHTSVIIGFNVRPAPRVADLAKQEKVDIRLHNIIYKVEEEMRKAMLGMLDPTTREVYLGRAEIRQVIKIPKSGNIGGCMVIDGIIKRTGQVRVVRDSNVIFEGHLASLRRFKDDVSEVKTGFECGISVDRFNDIKVGDILEVFTTEKVLPTEL